jgi:rRNA maturation endonuclease Nob1
MKKQNIDEDLPYKWKKKCKNCGRTYGVDYKGDNGYCPICCRGLKIGRGNFK